MDCLESILKRRPVAKVLACGLAGFATSLIIYEIYYNLFVEEPYYDSPIGPHWDEQAYQGQIRRTNKLRAEKKARHYMWGTLKEWQEIAKLFDIEPSKLTKDLEYIEGSFKLELSPYSVPLPETADDGLMDSPSLSAVKSITPSAKALRKQKQVDTDPFRKGNWLNFEGTPTRMTPFQFRKFTGWGLYQFQKAKGTNRDRFTKLVIYPDRPELDNNLPLLIKSKKEVSIKSFDRFPHFVRTVQPFDVKIGAARVALSSLKGRLCLDRWNVQQEHSWVIPMLPKFADWSSYPRLNSGASIDIISGNLSKYGLHVTILPVNYVQGADIYEAIPTLPRVEDCIVDTIFDYSMYLSNDDATGTKKIDLAKIPEILIRWRPIFKGTKRYLGGVLFYKPIGGNSDLPKWHEENFQTQITANFPVCEEFVLDNTDDNLQDEDLICLTED